MMSGLRGIVAVKDFVSQTSAISTTTIFTPTDDGTFLICVACNNNQGSTLGVPSISLTDEFGNAVTDSVSNIGATGQHAQLTKTYRCKANQPIQVSSTIQGGGSTTYDVYVVILQLE